MEFLGGGDLMHHMMQVMIVMMFVVKIMIMMQPEVLGALWASTSICRIFRPLDYVVCAFTI